MKFFLIALTIFLSINSVFANEKNLQALDILRKSDLIRAPNEAIRYTVALKEFKGENTKPVNEQVLDVSMRFIKPEGNKKADARSLIRFVYPPRDRGKIMLSDWYDLWFYTPELRRPMAISRQQRLIGQISNSDVLVTNFEYAYTAKLLDDIKCNDNICYQLSLIRKTPDITWPKVIYLVEKNSFRPFKASYFTLDDKLAKEVQYQEFLPSLGAERASKIIVTDARQKNSFSVMEYSNLKLESLPLYHFTKEYIQRGGK